MNLKEALVLLNQQISVRLMEKFDASADPQVFKLAGVITDAVQDVIDKLDK